MRPDGLCPDLHGTLVLGAPADVGVGGLLHRRADAGAHAGGRPVFHGGRHALVALGDAELRCLVGAVTELPGGEPQDRSGPYDDGGDIGLAHRGLARSGADGVAAAPGKDIVTKRNTNRGCLLPVSAPGSFRARAPRARMAWQSGLYRSALTSTITTRRCSPCSARVLPGLAARLSAAVRRRHRRGSARRPCSRLAAAG